MNQKIIVTIADLKNIEPKGYFFNLKLPDEFQIDCFYDRSHRLHKDIPGNSALVNTYGFSLETFDTNKALCCLLITKTPIEKFTEDVPQFIVEDIEQFMVLLARSVRKQYKNPVIGVTGSAGKSTVTKMLWRLLKSEQTDALTNMGNHNDRHSVPYYLINTIRNPDYTILEIAGDSLLKEKRFGNLAELAELDIGIVTSIGGAHLSRYKDNLNVAEIKSGLVEGIKIGGTLIINQDIEEEELNIFIKKAQARAVQVITYSLNDVNADAYLINKEWTKDYMKVVTSIENYLTRYELYDGSDGSIKNSIGVLLTLKTLGITLDKERLEKFKLVQVLPRVLAKRKYALKNTYSIQVIDDTHNASIPSMLNTIGYFKMLAESGKYCGNKILILARVADLGPDSQNLHQQFLEPIANSNADYIFLYGPQMKPLMKTLRKQKLLVYHYSDLNDLIDEALELVTDDSLIVMKGSRSESDFELISQRLPEKIISLGGKRVF